MGNQLHKSTCELSECGITDFIGGAFIWNLILYHTEYTKIAGCPVIGSIGLFWFNDNGEMMEHCFLSGQVGGRAQYIFPNGWDGSEG